ncbi:hypothetical protein EDD11_009260 [Mortierella claussenii]|nr:hypothetical protein EDD11_009260 [Mortierella claussenii]
MHLLASSSSRSSQRLSSSTYHFASSSTPLLSSSSLRTSVAARNTQSLAWSILCSIVVLNSFLAILSPSTAGGRALAGLNPGFCGDCQTFSNAIGVCGGSFGPTDIEINGEYVLQQTYSKCICTEVMQKVLWTCAKCEFLAGHQSKSPPPQKYQTQCMAWGMTIEEWRAPYKGVVAPGTQTDVGGGGANPPSVTPQPPVPTPSDKPAPNKPQPSSGGGGTNPTSGTGGDKPSSSSDPALPSSSSDNSVSGGGTTSESNSGPNTTAIGICVGIIGVAVVAGSIAVVMMKRRRRRHTPLDLDSLPGAGTQFVSSEDKWENPTHHHHHPASPPLPPAPIASAAPIVGRGGHRAGYDGPAYMEGSSIVGGYDGQYDGYDQYAHHVGGPGGAYDGYGGQYGGQYPDQHRHGGQYDQGYRPSHGTRDVYPMHEYGGHDCEGKGGVDPSPGGQFM